MVRLRRAANPAEPVAWALPATPLRGDSIETSARGLALSAVGVAPAWLAQMHTVDERGYSGRFVVVEYVALVAESLPDDGSRTDQCWCRVDGLLPELGVPDRAAIDRAVAHLRSRIELDPIAFRLLPASFTLTDLQRVYELVLGHALHKASFRRALFAARLVEPMEEWRQVPRGRPAQLYRYAPRTPPPRSRGVRFDRLR